MSSLQERVAKTREQRAQERTFELAVPGYESAGLWARYKVLSYEELRAIGDGTESIEKAADRELAEYADTIIRACVDLLEKQEDGSYQSLGVRWSAAGVRQLGIDLPENCTARQAVFSVFNGPSGGNDLFYHFRAYSVEAGRVGTAITEDVVGESEPSAEGSSTSLPTPPLQESA